MTLRVALLGTGAMAEYHHAKFAALEGVEVASCFDADPAKAEAFARAHGVPRPFASLADILDDAPDAVSCCLVDSLHFASGREVLERRVPLFMEKPLAPTLDEARRLVALASGAVAMAPVAMVNLSKRNAPALGALRRLVEAGTLGEVRSIDAAYLQGWVVSGVWGDWNLVPRWRWRLDNQFCTDGVVGDLGVHLMDALVQVFGPPTRGTRVRAHDLNSARAAGLVPPGPDVPGDPRRRPALVDAEAALDFGGIPCRFRLSWVEAGAVDAFRIRVEGHRATAVLDLERSRDAVEVRGFPERLSGPATASTYQRFAEAARSGRPQSPSLAEALVAQEALEAAFFGGAP